MEATNREHFAQAYHNQTNMDPLGLVLFLVLAVAMLAVKRRSALFPMLLALSLLSLTQRVVVAGLDFDVLRLMIVVGAVRVVARGEWKGLKLHDLDILFIVSVVYGFGMTALRDGTIGRFIQMAGEILDALGIYLLCRMFIRGWRDLDQLAKLAGITALLIAPFFVIEWQTGRNYFSAFGGIDPYSLIHHGRMRAKGAFAHMLVAGCFWVTLLPIISARFWNPRASKTLVAASSLATLAVVVSTASSTPIMGLVMSLFACLLFPLRANLRWVRWGAFGTLLALHLAMNAPVWHLMARLNVFGGSTGWHRFSLIDNFISHFREWWLMGTSYTGHWGGNLVDVTNVYVLQGIRGGLLNLLIYIAMLTIAFRRIGLLIRASEGRRTEMAFAWGLGVALFCHTVVQFAVSYFGEILFSFYVTIAAVSSISAKLATVPARKRIRAPRSRSPVRATPPAPGTGSELAGGAQRRP